MPKRRKDSSLEGQEDITFALVQNNAPPQLIRLPTHWRPSRNKTRLTRRLTERICNLLAAGVNHNVAAEACGVQRATFREWMRLDDNFRVQIQVAQSQALARAERYVYTHDPKFYLKYSLQARKAGWAKESKSAVSVNLTKNEVNNWSLDALSESELETLKALHEKASARQLPAKREIVDAEYSEVEDE